MPEHVLMSDYEVITDGAHGRRWSAAETLRIVEETLGDGASSSVVARRNGVARVQDRGSCQAVRPEVAPDLAWCHRPRRP